MGGKTNTYWFLGAKGLKAAEEHVKGSLWKI